jgi:uncharacterized protein (DUF433 family)
MAKISKFYGGDLDRREIPSYGILEAAQYLRMHPATLRAWIKGYPYSGSTGPKSFKPIFDLPDPDLSLLSFMNLVEAHILNAIRKKYSISLQSVRKAIDFLKRHFPSKHPLADYRFQTDGMNLFIQKYGELINVSKDGQIAMKELLEAYLKRIEWDLSGIPIKLFLYTRKEEPDEPKVIVIDPSVQYGRPVLVGTGITTAIIAERYKAGESVEELAEDYGRPPQEIQEAIRCELELKAA